MSQEIQLIQQQISQLYTIINRERAQRELLRKELKALKYVLARRNLPQKPKQAVGDTNNIKLSTYNQKKRIAQETSLRPSGQEKRQ